jgi:hypothetical protein
MPVAAAASVVAVNPPASGPRLDRPATQAMKPLPGSTHVGNARVLPSLGFGAPVRAKAHAF